MPVCVPALADFEFGASVFAAAFGALKSPALLIPPALTVLTQLESAANRGPVEVRLKFKTVLPETATIRLAFWKVRATFGGRIAVAMMLELALANMRASACPSKVRSIGTVSPCLR